MSCKYPTITIHESTTPRLVEMLALLQLKAIQQTKLQCKSISLVPFYKWKYTGHDRHHPQLFITGVYTSIIKPVHRNSGHGG